MQIAITGAGFSPDEADDLRRSLATFRHVGTIASHRERFIRGMLANDYPLEFAERCYDIAKYGEIPEDLWVDCVVASNVDDTLAPKGRHIMTCFVQYGPRHLKEGTWERLKPTVADRVLNDSIVSARLLDETPFEACAF